MTAFNASHTTPTMAQDKQVELQSSNKKQTKNAFVSRPDETLKKKATISSLDTAHASDMTFSVATPNGERQQAENQATVDSTSSVTVTMTVAEYVAYQQYLHAKSVELALAAPKNDDHQIQEKGPIMAEPGASPKIDGHSAALTVDAYLVPTVNANHHDPLMNDKCITSGVPHGNTGMAHADLADKEATALVSHDESDDDSSPLLQQKQFGTVRECPFIDFGFGSPESETTTDDDEQRTDLVDLSPKDTHHIGQGSARDDATVGPVADTTSMIATLKAPVLLPILYPSLHSRPRTVTSKESEVAKMCKRVRNPSMESQPKTSPPFNEAEVAAFKEIFSYETFATSHAELVWFELCCSQRRRSESSQSSANFESLAYIHETFVPKLCQLYDSQTSKKFAIITPYSAQVTLHKERFAKFQQDQSHLDARFIPTVATIRAARYNQYDTVVLDLVCSGAKRAHHLGFLVDDELVDIAITRSKKALWIVGCELNDHYQYRLDAAQRILLLRVFNHVADKGKIYDVENDYVPTSDIPREFWDKDERKAAG